MESHLAIDVNVWNREGFLVPGRTFTVTWRVNRESVAAVGLEVQERAMELSYTLRYRDNEVQRFSYPVSISWTPCRFGGRRPWLHCPCCNRRVVKVYLVRGHFCCRRCGHLTYASQREDRAGRALRRVNRIRERLGGPRGPLSPFPMRPDRMRASTYARLRAVALEVERRVLETSDARLERLERLLADAQRDAERP